MPSLHLNRVVASVLAVLAGATSLAAQDQAQPPADTATLQQRLDALEQQVSQMKERVQQASDTTTALGKSVDKLKAETNVDDAFAWGGDVDLSLDFRRKTSTDPGGRTVGVSISPMFLYSWRDEWLAVAELDVDSKSGETSTELGQAFISFTGLESVVFTAGKAPLPFGAYTERLSASWINKFGEVAPTPYNDDFGLFGMELMDMQLQARGVVDLGSNRRLNWHAFVSQGPSYAMNDGSDDRLAFGTNSGPNNEPPTIGGRVGFIPQPGIEIGASAMGGRILNNNTAFTPDDRRSFLSYAVDAECRIAGVVLRGEWVALKYDASDDSRVNSQSGYVQASKRLKELGAFWANVEPVIRVGELRRNRPVTMAADYEKVYEYGLGVNYYHTSTIRTSLAADAFNGEAHELNRVVLNTTFLF